MSSFTINVFNSLAPQGKRIIITGILEQVDFQETVDGEVVWIIRLVTNFNGYDGNPVAPVYVTATDQETLTKEVRKAVSIIASQIDWGDVDSDTKPPFITDINPKPNQENVPIESLVKLSLKDAFPTTGIDPSSIKLRVNGIDVTSQLNIGGIDNEFIVYWDPPKETD